MSPLWRRIRKGVPLWWTPIIFYGYLLLCAVLILSILVWSDALVHFRLGFRVLAWIHGLAIAALAILLLPERSTSRFHRHTARWVLGPMSLFTLLLLVPGVLLPEPMLPESRGVVTLTPVLDMSSAAPYWALVAAALLVGGVLLLTRLGLANKVGGSILITTAVLSQVLSPNLTLRVDPKVSLEPSVVKKLVLEVVAQFPPRQHRAIQLVEIGKSPTFERSGFGIECAALKLDVRAGVDPIAVVLVGGVDQVPYRPGSHGLPANNPELAIRRATEVERCLREKRLGPVSGGSIPVIRLAGTPAHVGSEDPVAEAGDRVVRVLLLGTEKDADPEGTAGTRGRLREVRHETDDVG